MDNKDYIVGIDIGSSNVVMAVGVRDENGEIAVLCSKSQEVGDSVKDGSVVNYIELGKAINAAKSALESKLKRRLNSAYVGISGKSVYCVRYEDYVDISDKTGCVTENELRELQSRIDMVVPGGGDEIVNRIPLRYRVDDRSDVKNPLGTFGKKLSGSYLFVMVGRQQIELVNRAMHQADIKICGLCVTPTILHPLLLNNEEMEEGAMIVDMGSEVTDISIVREGKLWYFSSLPIGGSSINKDLHEFMKIMKGDVEKYKRTYGSAIADKVPENATISVKIAHSNRQISQHNLSQIIEERLKDITGFINRELKNSKYQSKIPCGAVLTGGSAYLTNIDELFARELHMEVRISNIFNGINEDSQQEMSTYTESGVAALLLYGAEHNACDTTPGIVTIQPKEEVKKEQHTEEINIFSGQNGNGGNIATTPTSTESKSESEPTPTPELTSTPSTPTTVEEQPTTESIMPDSTATSGDEANGEESSDDNGNEVENGDSNSDDTTGENVADNGDTKGSKWSFSVVKRLGKQAVKSVKSGWSNLLNGDPEI